VTATGERAPSTRFDLVVAVTSLGGLKAVSMLLDGLPEEFPVPLVILQHRARGEKTTQQLIELLQRHTSLPVRTVRSGDQVNAPGVSVLPGGFTAEIDHLGQFRLQEADRLGGGDALLTSAADMLGGRVIGVVLTGLLRDGAEGARAVKAHGGYVLAQEPATARAASMPSAAIATGCVDLVLACNRMAAAIVALTLPPGTAELLR
jgi:two-component system chemotaxis response regulator CheB